MDNDTYLFNVSSMVAIANQNNQAVIQLVRERLDFFERCAVLLKPLAEGGEFRISWVNWDSNFQVGAFVFGRTFFRKREFMHMIVGVPSQYQGKLTSSGTTERGVSVEFARLRKGFVDYRVARGFLESNKNFEVTVLGILANRFPSPAPYEKAVSGQGAFLDNLGKQVRALDVQ